jgi:hypothetical protein
VKEKKKKILRENEFFFLLPLQTNDSSQPSVIQKEINWMLAPTRI